MNISDEKEAEIKHENPELYRVAINKGTEAPFVGELLKEERQGDYLCAVCGNPLFKSGAKFDSGTGWPSFDQSISGSTKEISDTSHGMSRTEVVCAKCDAHLGHVFPDGPTETGSRYCMNSVCLSFTEDKNKLN
jgi:peptide-methionine (R)-S-oxide reductase